MEIISSTKIYNFIKAGRYFFSLSIALFTISIALFFTKGLNYGIDFSGGTVIQIQYSQKAPIDAIRKALQSSPYFKGALVTKFGSDDEIIIKTPISHSGVGEDMGDIANSLLKGTGKYEIRRVDMVGPKVGKELKEKGLTSLALAMVAIMIYVAIRFEWRFALAAIIALFHDLFVTVGFLSLIGIDVNLDTVAALLTILGYSINDTIIIFDRIREVIRENIVNSLGDIINVAVSNTLPRTLLTSLTTFFVVLTLYLFGGEIIRGFSLPLIIGIIVGTYSSIFVASVLLVVLRFNVKSYKEAEIQKEKRKKERERIRAMYEKGVV